jgi:hypothetical protein
MPEKILTLVDIAPGRPSVAVQLPTLPCAIQGLFSHKQNKRPAFHVLLVMFVPTMA